MFKNYLLVAMRNLSRNKGYAFINITGLVVGLTCTMLILLYIKDEVSFDRFQTNGNNIYRIVSKSKRGGKLGYSESTGYFQGPKFTQNVPGIKHFVRVQSNSEDIKTGNDIHSQDLLYVDSSFFQVFSFPLISGNRINCLKDPNSVVISEAVAKRQFGTKDAVGKTIQLKRDGAFKPFTVSAVAENCPQNSSIQFEVLLPIVESDADKANSENWFNFFLNTFVLLDDKANAETVSQQMQAFYLRDAKSVFDMLIQKYGGGPDASMGEYFLQPYLDIHMSTDLPAQNGMVHASNPMFSYILSGIALFILLIACINFVNLSVARSVKRAKEIGIRKVVGGDRKQLVFQFLGESYILSLVAFLLSVGVVILLLPFFNHLADKALAFSYLLDTKLIVSFIALFLITGFLAGFYPAMVLSGYNPVETLYSRFNIAGKNYLQKSLVVLQFSLASFLIIAAFAVYFQFDFLTKKDLGYDDKDVVVVAKNSFSYQGAAAFREELKRNPSIVEVAFKNNGDWQTAARNAVDTTIQFAYETVDENYIPMMKIPLITGRNFSREFPSDSNSSVIVNESFVKAAGWQNPIGETVNFWYNNNERYKVIGVVKDYHFKSLNEKIMPQLFTMKRDNSYGQFFIKIKPGSASASLAAIQKTFRQFFPLDPYTYDFKDLKNYREYESVSKWKQIILFGAVLTILISCFGLFGLSVLSAEKRMKEIGIRKVLGASVNTIVRSLSMDFVKLVLISLIIAIPVSYWAADKWLQNFPYRISLGWWLFAAAAVLVVLIALVTISFQSVKAAVSNPVKSLKSE